jgi:hypothetical protein
MRRLLLPIGILLGLLAAAPVAAAPVVAVIFEVNLGEGGAVTSLKVSGLAGREGERLPKSIPDAFIAAAREHLSQVYRGHPPGHFFTYMFFDPDRPTDANPEEAPPPAAEALGPSIAIERGESLTLKLPDAGGGEPVVVGRESAPPGLASQMEEANWRMVLDQGHGSGSHDFKPTRLDLPKQPKIEPNLVRLTMKPGPKGNDTSLMVENGYPRMLRYRAVMSRDGKPAEPTSVCEVMPGIVSFEYWSYPLDRLELGRFELVDVPSDRKVACR